MGDVQMTNSPDTQQDQGPSAKRAERGEEKLRESEERFRVFLEHARAAVSRSSSRPYSHLFMVMLQRVAGAPNACLCPRPGVCYRGSPPQPRNLQRAIVEARTICVHGRGGDTPEKRWPDWKGLPARFWTSIFPHPRPSGSSRPWWTGDDTPTCSSTMPTKNGSTAWTKKHSRKVRGNNAFRRVNCLLTRAEFRAIVPEA
jgi:hypothetical protein